VDSARANSTTVTQVSTAIQTSTARGQSRFQVRFAWGIAGAADISGGAHVIVWVDALVAAGVPELQGSTPVLVGTVGNREATAHWILDLQERLGDRAVIAVVAAGDATGGFAVEDFLAAGAVIDALADLGIDYCSPEAASAGAAFAGLRNATAHLLSASVAGQEAGVDAVKAARAANSAPDLQLVREWISAD
jgi:2-phosphosulfolactate phosphatase